MEQRELRQLSHLLLNFLIYLENENDNEDSSLHFLKLSTLYECTLAVKSHVDNLKNV